MATDEQRQVGLQVVDRKVEERERGQGGDRRLLLTLWLAQGEERRNSELDSDFTTTTSYLCGLERMTSCL